MLRRKRGPHPRDPVELLLRRPAARVAESAIRFFERPARHSPREPFPRGHHYTLGDDRASRYRPFPAPGIAGRRGDRVACALGLVRLGPPTRGLCRRWCSRGVRRPALSGQWCRPAGGGCARPCREAVSRIASSLVRPFRWVASAVDPPRCVGGAGASAGTLPWLDFDATAGNRIGSARRVRRVPRTNDSESCRQSG